MRIYLALPVFVLLALLQTTLMPFLAIANVPPDLALAAVVCWALYRGASDGALAGLLAGIALDLLSGAPFGMHTFAMTIVGMMAGLAVTVVPNEHAMLLPGIAVLCTIVQQASCVYLLRAAGWPLHWPQVLLSVTLPASLLNLLLTALLYPVIGWIYRRVTHGAVAVEAGW